MSSRSKNIITTNKLKSLLIIFASVVIAAGCQVKFVADYDAKNAQQILQVAKRVDYFYTKLLNEAENKRTYDKSKTEYVDIEVELRSLLMRNEIKPLNKESIKIISTIIKKWKKYQFNHKSNNAYKTVLLENHRDRFVRLFVAMSVAEEAKRQN